MSFSNGPLIGDLFKSNLDIAMANTPKPTLLSLPRELRDHIYVKIFEDSTHRITSKSQLTPLETPGTLVACKQTYTEAIGIYFQLIAFLCVPGRAAAWMEGLSADKLAQVKHIHLDVGSNVVEMGCSCCRGSFGVGMGAFVVEYCCQDIDSAFRGKGVPQRSGVVKCSGIFPDGSRIVTDKFCW